MNNEVTAELRVVPARELASEPPPDDAPPLPPPLATARKAVPLLWLGLFDFAEAEVRAGERGDVFFAVTGVKAAVGRAEALAKALPAKNPALAALAELVARQLRKHPASHFVTLFPTEIFAALRPEQVKRYLTRLFGVCEIWEKVRQGTSWLDARRLLDQLGPELGAALNQEQRVLSYYLVGTLAEQLDPIYDARVREGQDEGDKEPEALAVGEQGLLLGRFRGRWKLMSSGADQDLKDIWGEPDNVFIVGRQGTILRFRRGACARMESPTKAHLHAVWGQNPRFVCATGDDGTLLAYRGKGWEQWAVPNRTSLLCIGGTNSEICLGTQDLTILRYDGRSWARMQLPDQGMASRIWSQDGQIFAIGGSRQGGELYSLRRGVWERDKSLPRTDWLEVVWTGWESDLGLVSSSGPLLLRKDGCWSLEERPAERIVDVASGSLVLAAGQIGRYGVLLARDSKEGWKLEASVPDLRLGAVWVAGRPKPPRLSDGGEPGAQTATGQT